MLINTQIDADWCWLILLDADWFWLMLIDSDWSWLVLIDAQIRFNWVFFCQSVLPEFLTVTFINRGPQLLFDCRLGGFTITQLSISISSRRRAWAGLGLWYVNRTKFLLTLFVSFVWRASHHQQLTLGLLLAHVGENNCDKTDSHPISCLPPPHNWDRTYQCSNVTD